MRFTTLHPALTRSAVLAAAAAAALLLAACGGSSTGGSGSAGTAGSDRTSSSPDPTDDASPEPTDDASTSASTSPSTSGGGSAPAPGELTEAGTKLAIGKPAVVEWAASATDPVSQIQVTVTTATKGSLEDFAGTPSADKLVGYVPYYIDVTYTAVTDNPDEYPSPYLGVRGTTSAGASAQTLITIGFDKCSSPSFPKLFTAGTEVSGCRALLVPEGQTMAAITFPSGPTSSAGVITWTL